MKEQEIYKPLNLTGRERKQIGEMLGYLRIAIFRKGILADGATPTHEMIGGLAKLMKEKEGLAYIFVAAVNLYEALKEDPRIEEIINALLESSDAMLEDCQCQACTMYRAIKGQSAKEN